LKPIGLIGGMSSCTEIGLLIGLEDVEVPLHDTTRLHARAAVTLALEAA
jgi:aspartate racemase